MASQDGLFSGLRFTDILFPAAASIASAYNPYIGRGLQTGMNLFNTMANFQQSAQYWKQLKEQQEREAEQIARAQEAAGPLVSFQEQLAAARRAEIEEQQRRAMEGQTFQGPSGSPVPRDSVSGLPTGYNVFGPETLQGLDELQAPTPSDDLMRSAGVNRFSDMIPLTMQSRTESAALNDPAYVAAMQRALGMKFQAEGLPLSPAGAMSTIGGFGQQAHGQQLDIEQARELYKTINEYQEDQVVRDLLLKGVSQENALEVLAKSEEKKINTQNNWAKIQATMNAVGDESPLGMKDDVLFRNLRLAKQALDQASIFSNPNDPQQVADIQGWRRIVYDLEEEWEARKRRRGGSGDEGGTNSTSGDASSRAEAWLSGVPWDG